MNGFFKTKKRYILPILHFVLTFAFERTILIFDLDKDVVETIAKSDIVSDSAERIIGYIFAKIFAFVFVVFLWELVFFAIDNIKKTYARCFMVLSLAGAVILLLAWPGPFVESTDNVITFSYALRLWPEYWHSAYTSIIYTACMMICPFAFSIGLFQWFFAIFVFAYLYKRIFESEKLPSTGRFFIFLIVLMPGIFTLVTNSYRTEGYALLCMYLIEKVTMDIVDGKKASFKELIKLMFIVGFTAVWRSEGIILGLLTFGVYLIFAQGYKITKIVLLSIATVGIVGLIMLPQKIGDIKYYGKDYSFINSFLCLKNILNSEEANLSYEGVEADLQAFDKVTPLPILKKYGMEGYRRYNYANGRTDINQSLCDDETASAYTKAYRNLVIHNLPIYLKTQASEIATMLMLRELPIMIEYGAALENEPEPWIFNAWETGFDDIDRYSKPVSKYNETIYNIIRKPFTVMNNILARCGFYTILLITITLLEAIILVRELVLAFAKKKADLGLGGISFVLLAQLAAIALVVPDSALVYLHAYYYSSFILVLIYILKFIGTKTGRKNGKI